MKQWLKSLAAVASRLWSWTKGVSHHVWPVLGVLAVAALCAWSGFHYGKRSAQPNVTAAGYCGQDADSVARRNVYWSTFNGDIDPETESPDVVMALTVAIILKPDVPLPLRGLAVKKYLEKVGVFFSEEDQAAIAKGILTGSTEERWLAFRRMADADGQAADTIRCVLHDDSRIQLFLLDVPIPLEKTR